MVKKGNFNRAPLGCFFKIYRYWYTDLLFEVKFYFVSEHLPDDSDKLAGTVPKCIVVRPAFSPLGIIISITIEAAFAIPLFLFAALCLIWMIEIQSIKIGVKQAAYSAAKSAAEDTAVIPVLNTIKLKSDIIRLLGKERIERSIIVDGSEGISCWNSYLSSKTGEMNIHVKYEVRVPLPLFGNPSAKMEETFRIHGWTGYGKDKKTEDSEIVYITEKQSVYHEDYHCSYLQLSIRFVPYEQLEEIRNENGGIYYACEKCVYGDASTGVYITENGSKYHNSLGCSGLKRTIRAVKKTEVQGIGGCSRCSGK